MRPIQKSCSSSQCELIKHNTCFCQSSWIWLIRYWVLNWLFGHISGKTRITSSGLRAAAGPGVCSDLCALEHTLVTQGEEKRQILKALKSRSTPEDFSQLPPTHAPTQAGQRLTRFLKSAVSSLVKTENLRKAEPRSGSSLHTQFSPNFSRAWVYCSSFSTWAEKHTQISRDTETNRDFSIFDCKNFRINYRESIMNG